jgi:hypothetical protein
MARRSPEGLRTTVTMGPEWKRVERALRAVDEHLAGEFRDELRDAADVLARRTQQEVMRIPTYTANHSGLRARVAKGVGVKFSPVGVNVTASMNYKDERNLPAYLDLQAGWRHPVFGDRSVWVHQGTGGSWFRETLEGGHDMIADRLERIFDNAARTISRAGS